VSGILTRKISERSIRAVTRSVQPAVVAPGYRPRPPAPMLSRSGLGSYRLSLVMRPTIDPARGPESSREKISERSIRAGISAVSGVVGRALNAPCRRCAAVHHQSRRGHAIGTTCHRCPGVGVHRWDPGPRRRHARPRGRAQQARRRAPARPGKGSTNGARLLPGAVSPRCRRTGRRGRSATDVRFELWPRPSPDSWAILPMEFSSTAA
jgi:hypothetical protein